MKFYRAFYTYRRYISAKYSENYFSQFMQKLLWISMFIFFSQKRKKKRYSRFDVETKLTHWFLFFISVKFPRVANIHFLQSASNYVIRENFSKKKKTKSHLKNLRIRIKKIFYRFILFWISWKFRFPFWKVRDNLIR